MSTDSLTPKMDHMATPKAHHMATFKSAKPHLEKEGINSAYIDRFSRVAEKYGYNPSDSNILEFCTLILDQPSKFKDTSIFLNSKWKSPKTISEMLRSVKAICESSFIKNKLGDKTSSILKELKDYKQVLIQEAKKSKDNVTNLDQNEIKMIKNAKAKQKNDSNRPELYKNPPLNEDSDQSTNSEPSQSTSHNSELKKKQKDVKNITNVNKLGLNKKNNKKRDVSSENSSTSSSSLHSSLSSFVNSRPFDNLKRCNSNTIHDDQHIIVSKVKYKKMISKLIEIQNLANSLFAIIHEDD